MIQTGAIDQARRRRLCNERFKEIVKKLELDKAIITQAEASPSSLATLLEGLVGAVYLDAREKGADVNKAIEETGRALGI